jgi:hypothetical protein
MANEYSPPGKVVNNAPIVGLALVTGNVVGAFAPLAAPLQVTKYFPASGTAEAVRTAP